MLGRKRDAEADNGLEGVRVGRRGWVGQTESSTDIYIPCAKQTASGKLVCSTGSSPRCSVMTWRGDMGGMLGRLMREGILVLRADSHSCTIAETNTTL